MNQPGNNYNTLNNRTAVKRPFSYWWIIGTFIASIVFYGIAGGLFSQGPCDEYDDCPTAAWQGAEALCAIGALCSLAWFILLIVFLVKRQNGVHWNASTGLMNSQNFGNGSVQPQTQAETQPVMHQQYEMGKQENADTGGGYCGACGKRMTTKFCTSCGAGAEQV
jgi:hypothetical protein